MISASFLAAASAPLAFSASAPLDLHLGRIAAAVTVCALAALAIALAMRRFHFAKSTVGGRPKRNAISVLETKRLGLHADVCRLSCDGREYVVVVGSAGATIIASHDQHQTEAPS